MRVAVLALAVTVMVELTVVTESPKIVGHIVTECPATTAAWTELQLQDPPVPVLCPLMHVWTAMKVLLTPEVHLLYNR